MNQSFFARRSFTILMAAVFMMPFIAAGTRRALETNRNDVKDWLPADFPETKTHRWFQEHFPHEQFVLVSWEGCTLDDPRLELLARKLEAQPDAEREAGEPWFFKHVITANRLIDRLGENLTAEQVTRRLEGSLIGQGSDKTCLLVTLSAQAKGKNLHATLDKIRELAAQDCAIPSDDLRMGGPPVDNVAIDVEGERTLWRLAGLSAVVGLGISWLCFRSYRLTFLVFFVGLLAAGMGLASVYFTGVIATLAGLEDVRSTYGTVDAILLSMPSLVYVLAISGAVHIVNYYHDAVAEHGLERAPERALAHGAIPCTLAAITTALGLGSLLASHLIPISKFGIYCAWGVLVTLSLLLLFLPACLQFFPSREYAPGGTKQRGEDSSLTRFWLRVGEVVVGHNRLVTAGCLAVMLVSMVGLSRVETSVKLMKLFSPDAEIIQHYEWLEHHIGPLVPMEVVVRFDNQKCRRLQMIQRMRMVRDLANAIEVRLKDDVGGAMSAATFVSTPIGRTSRRATDRFKLSFLGGDRSTNVGLENHRDDFRDYLTVDGDATLDELTAVGEEPGIPPTVADRLRVKQLTTLGAIRAHGDLTSLGDISPQEAQQVDEVIREWLADNGEELWRISFRVWALSDVDYSVFVHELKDHVEKILDDQYRKLSEAERQTVKPIEGIAVTYTGMVPLVYKAQHELMHGLYNSLKWAFVLIGMVMILVLRSPSAGLLSMVPNIFPVVIVFGAMGWMGVLIDVGTMMTASVALGVAVDDTIHFLTWFRRGLDEGRSRKGAVMLAYRRCGTAMSQTTLIGGLGLSVFAFSTFTPTQRFGVLMITLLSAALAGDLIFLPAVLSGPLGRIFRPSRRPPGGSPDDRSPAEPSDAEVVAVPMAGSPSAQLPHQSRSQRAPGTSTKAS